MKSKRTLLWIVVVLIGLAALLRFRSSRPTLAGAPATSTSSPVHSTHKETILIKDGQTVDFSSGHPVITSTQDGADLRADLEAMQAASEGLVFSGEDLPPAPEEPTTATPSPAPSP